MGLNKPYKAAKAYHCAREGCCNFTYGTFCGRKCSSKNKTQPSLALRNLVHPSNPTRRRTVGTFAGLG